MKKNLYLTLTAAIFFILVAFNIRAETPLSNKSLNITLKTSEIDNPTIAEISTSNTPPDEYRISLVSDFYKIRLLDRNRTVLYFGEFVNKESIPPDPIDPEGPGNGGMTITQYEIINLKLPYFSETRFVRFSDESDNTLLETSLELYGFPDPSIRYAECDSCGYCRYARVPGDWEKCRACIYPDARKDPLTGDTLKIDSATGLQVMSKKGHAYTQLGCIRSDGLDSESGRAASINFILTVLSGLTGAMAMIFLSYGAFLISKSKGDVEQINHGKRIITKTIIGTILAVTAILIVSVIAGGALGIPGFK